MNAKEKSKLASERELARREAAEGRALAIERAKHAARVEERKKERNR